MKRTRRRWPNWSTRSFGNPSPETGATAPLHRRMARTSEPAARRIENRVAGADANPYLAMAATLACGYLGIVEKLKPTEVTTGSAYAHDYQLPRGLSEALRELENAKALHEVLGKNFVDVYLEGNFSEQKKKHTSLRRCAANSELLSIHNNY